MPSKPFRFLDGSITMAQLRVPSPDGPPQRDETQISFELWVGLVLAILVVFFGWLFWLHPHEIVDDEPHAEVEDSEERRALVDRDEFDGFVESGRIERIDWLDDEQRAIRVFEVAARPATEVVCQQYAEKLSDGVASRAMNLALLQLVSRRSNDAPWSCLFGLYLDRHLPEDSSVNEEMAAFWSEVETGAHGRLMKSVVSDLDAADKIPDDAAFNHWLRRCALVMEYTASQDCQRVLGDKAPRFGDDLLEMLIGHLADPDVLVGDLRLAASALTYFVQYGQPNGWFTDETPALPEYDEAFKVGALFQLCRLINAPIHEVREAAVEGLGTVAGVSGRPTSAHMQYRWRQSCRYAFGAGDGDERPHRVPALAVVVADGEEESADYGMQTLIERGLCENEADEPLWACGARRWTGEEESIHRVMGRHFALTSYIEWYEEDEIEEIARE